MLRNHLLQQNNVSWNEGREKLRLTVFNGGDGFVEVSYQVLLSTSAKMTSFSMTQHDMTYHGKKMAAQKAHEIVKRAAEEKGAAGFYIPRTVKGKFAIYVVLFT